MMCPTHQCEFTTKQGKFGPWYPCPMKNADGTYCGYSFKPGVGIVPPKNQPAPPVPAPQAAPAGPSLLLQETQRQTRLLEEVKMLLSTLVHRTPPPPVSGTTAPMPRHLEIPFPDEAGNEY